MLRPFCGLCALFCLALIAPPLAAQDAFSRVVIDGTQNPPVVIFKDPTIQNQVSDDDVGDYTLTFDTTVLYLIGTSITRRPGFDAAPRFSAPLGIRPTGER
jgi:hypothetical protein